MVGSTKDMLDSNILPATEEVVSKSETSKLAHTPSETEKRISELLQERVFQRSTYVPIQVHTVDSNRPLAMKALIDCGATAEFIDHELSMPMNSRRILSHTQLACIMQTDRQMRLERSPKQSTWLFNTKATEARPNSTFPA